jgi:predicted membrane-bound spermidine synthase
MVSALPKTAGGPPRDRGAARWAVGWCAVAFGSGVAALIFQTLWFRSAGLALGNGVWASSVVLAAFMAGLALGNGLAARRADDVQRPARLYAGLELAIGVAGFAVVLGLPLVTLAFAPMLHALRDTPTLLNPFRLALAFAVLMLPTTAMGATLPVLVKALSRHDPRFARVLGRLYGWNTLGAVLGALAGESFLLAALGVHGTAAAALGVNLLSACGALALARAAVRVPEARPALPRATHPGRRWIVRRLLLSAFLSGATFLALEVVWFRFLALFVYGTSLVFAVLLAVVLVGIALGGLSAARWLRDGRRAAPALPALALSSACATLIGYAGYGTVLAALLSPGHAAAALWHVALLAVPLMLPAAWLSGVLFTGLGEAAREQLGGEARPAGLLTLANTVGGATGSLLGGFWLLPRVGIEGSFLLLAGAYGLIAVLTWPGAERRGRALLSPALMTVALLALLAVFPSGALRSRYLLHPTRSFEEPGSRIVSVREGLLQTIVLMRTERFGHPLHHRLFTDGFSMSATTPHSRRYMKAYVYLPAAIHPALHDALLISYGVGSTAKALTDTGSIERIDVVDISPDVLSTSALIFPRREEDPLADPRVTVYVEDGRFFLQTTDRRYDLVTSEPPPPKYAGVVNLYSREYFELIHARLNEGGLVTYWLPVHNLTESDALAIARAFCEIFADCTLWSGAGMDWMLLGSRGGTPAIDATHFAQQWDDPVVGPELRALGFETPAYLGTTFLAGAATLARWTQGVAPVVDAFPLRISHEPVQPADTHTSSFFRSTLAVGRAAREFDESPFIRRTWPEPVRAATRRAFPWQRMINARLVYDGSTLSERDLHGVLTQSGLRTLPLWMLGTEVDEVRLARGIAPESESHPDADRIRGLGALADRDFAAAATWLARARSARPADGRLAGLEIYALCLADRRDEALVRARALVASHPDAAASHEYWRFLAETFGLPDPRRPEAARRPDPPGIAFAWLSPAASGSGGPR